MSKLSRTKGHNWEREVARLFRDAGIPMQRTLTETRDGNCGDLRGQAPLSIQCKVSGRPDVWGAIREAQEAASPGDYAVAVLRRNRASRWGKQDVAVLPLKDFLEIAATLKRERIW